MNSFAFLMVALMVAVSSAFTPAKFSPKSMTRVYEDFNLDFGNPEIVSDKLIFTEKQLREFTATYSVDYRMNPLEFLTGLFSKKEESSEDSGSSIASSLKKSVSIEVIQSKTAEYIKGKISAAQFKTVLKAAFGDKLESVLPEINANLPKGKKL